jgi:hypothetical protein
MAEPAGTASIQRLGLLFGVRLVIRGCITIVKTRPTGGSGLLKTKMSNIEIQVVGTTQCAPSFSRARHIEPNISP